MASSSKVASGWLSRFLKLLKGGIYTDPLGPIINRSEEKKKQQKQKQQQRLLIAIFFFFSSHFFLSFFFQDEDKPVFYFLHTKNKLE